MSSEITINSNIASLQTQRRLGQNSSALNHVFERLSSGQRINRASDDAAGLAISDSLRADRRVMNQGVKNLNDGASMMNIADGALSELTNIVTRIKELAEQAANGTLGSKQRSALDAEAQGLSQEYFRIARTATFNGLNLFDGSIQGLTLQSGYGAGGGVNTSMGGNLGTGNFAAEVNYTSGGSTASVALGDVNGDGVMDLVSANQSADVASVMIGNGNGTFKAKTDYTIGVAAANVALADLNGDGFADIATANSGGGNVSVLLGNGNGTFKAKNDYTTMGQTEHIAIGDMNGDGSLDIVAATYASPVVSVLINNGNGTFKARNDYTTGTAPFSVEMGDFNGDGILDITTGNYSDGSISVLLGNGNGTFKARTDYTSAMGIYSVAVGDLNGDGILDIAASNYLTAKVSVWLGNGNGSFKAATDYDNLGYAESLNLSDINGDGIQDIVATSSGAFIAVLLGNGNGSFRDKTDFAISAPSGSVTTGDINGDGVPDIVAANEGINSVSILLQATKDGVSPLLKFSLKNRGDALQAMGDLSRSLARISAQRGYLGAFQSRIGSAISNSQITIENFAAAESQIRDTDVAQDAASLARGQILQQAAASILAQANAEPQIALMLLRG